MIIGQHGPAVVISAETAYYLETVGKVSAVRQRLRDGRHQQVSRELLDLRHVAMSFDPALVAQVAQPEEASAQPAAELESKGLTVLEVADRLNLSTAAVTKACRERRLRASRVGARPRWLIPEDAVRDYQAARAV